MFHFMTKSRAARHIALVFASAAAMLWKGKQLTSERQRRDTWHGFPSFLILFGEKSLRRQTGRRNKLRNKRNTTSCFMNGGDKWLLYNCAPQNVGRQIFSSQCMKLALMEALIQEITCAGQLVLPNHIPTCLTLCVRQLSGGRAMFALGSYLGFQSKSCRSLREQSGRIKRFRLEMKRDGREKICRIAESKKFFSYVQVFIFPSRVGDT